MKKLLKFFRSFVLGLIFTVCVLESCFAYTYKKTPLTLANTIHIAIEREPTLQQTTAKINALEQQAIANGQLPDPKIGLGIVNVPTDQLSLTRSDMTMTEVGITQYFPAGHILAHKSQQTQDLATAERERKNEQTLALVRDVSNTWLELYYATQAINIIKSKQQLLKNIVRATKSQYAVGKANQSVVLQTQLEASELDDKKQQLQQQVDSLHATLAGWVGQVEAARSLPNELPKFTTKPLAVLQNNLLTHPLLKEDAANIQAAHEDVALSKEQYRPDFDVGVGYGLRQGTETDGTKRSNFVSAEVNMDLPIFTAKRQDKNLAASKNKFVAAELDRQIHYRNLSAELAGQYAAFQRLSDREAIYNKNIIPKAKQNIKLALLAYQSATADLVTVLRAYIFTADLELEKLRIAIDQRKTQVNINYLTGGSL